MPALPPTHDPPAPGPTRVEHMKMPTAALRTPNCKRRLKKCSALAGWTDGGSAPQAFSVTKLFFLRASSSNSIGFPFCIRTRETRHGGSLFYPPCPPLEPEHGGGVARIPARNTTGKPPANRYESRAITNTSLYTRPICVSRRMCEKTLKIPKVHHYANNVVGFVGIPRIMCYT